MRAVVLYNRALMDTTPITEKFLELRNETTKGISFVDLHGKVKRYSYAEITELSRKFAGGLRKKRVNPGEPVILVMTDPQSAIIAILGCMILGCPPTPVYPPQRLQAVKGFLGFMKHVAERSRATLIVAEGQPYAFLGSLPHETETIRSVEKFETLFQEGSVSEYRSENPVAFLQFTSGSTAEPKGVIVSHRGLAANLWMIRTSSHMSNSSCVVTWLPVYHDMGLIGTVLNAISLPCDLVVLSPMTFLKKPRLWVEMITQFHGTHTAAPNFAYGLSTKRVNDVNGLDLSSMTTFICGAEPIIPATMEKFISHYDQARLRPESLVPAYGLAEATLAVTFTPYLRGMKSDSVDLNSLSEKRIAKPLERIDSPHSIRIVSCGAPMTGLSVRIADDHGNLLQERKVGEIQISGPSVTAASRTFDNWLRTGDLGYMANGELHVCGRLKDIVIIRGKNFHAHDLESIASEVPGVRTGNVIAFSSKGESGEALLIVAEAHDPTPALRAAVRGHISDAIGISPDEVILVPPGTLPKTSSGKLKRIETRQLFESGRLHRKTGKGGAYVEVLKSGLGFLRKKN
jgi:fatty-acyl-CoA synthase